MEETHKPGFESLRLERVALRNKKPMPGSYPEPLEKLLQIHDGIYDPNADPVWSASRIKGTTMKVRGSGSLFDLEFLEFILRRTGASDLFYERGGGKRFFIYPRDADDPKTQNFLSEIWIVAQRAVTSAFPVVIPQVPEQPLPLERAIRSFIEKEGERWGRGPAQPADLLYGILGESARGCEYLGFGLHVADVSHGIIRVWSRAEIQARV